MNTPQPVNMTASLQMNSQYQRTNPFLGGGGGKLPNVYVT